MKQLQSGFAALAKAANLVGKPVDAPQVHPVPHEAHHHDWPRKNDPVLEHLLRDFRSAKLRKHFFTHDAKEYIDTLDVKVLTGTYNVAGKKPPPGLKLHEWLHQWDRWPQAAGGAASGPDIVIIGFQEVVPLSAGNVIAGPSTAGADAWDFVLASTLNGDEWAGKNYGRTFGSSLASQAMYSNLERLGSQAAYAYSVISGQAANVVGAMDKMWAGSPDGNGQQHLEGPEADSSILGTSAVQQQARVAMALGSNEDREDVYIQVANKQLVGVYLTVWARKRVARHIRGVQSTAAATGFGGLLANKGAVAVRMRVHDAALLAVCSHLASGDAEGDELKRNCDVAEILRRCVFGGDAQQPGDVGNQSSSNGNCSGHWGSMSNILDHDNVVWLGDLNYRLTCSNDDARRHIRAGKLEALLDHDQLTQEMEAGRIFQGWREGPITFNPTYKYHLGCNVYSGDPLPPAIAAVKAVDSSASLADSASDTTEDSAAAGRDSPSVEKLKKRTPAWCDRILWLPGRQLFQLAYGRGEIAVSDHRPVAAAFLLQAHRYNRDAVQQLAEAARRQVDMSDNAARPRCSLTPNFIELQLVPLGHPKRFTVHLANEGSCAARYYFVPPPKPRMSNDGLMSWDDNQPISPPWLQISPAEGEVAPGETASITLTAFVAGGGPNSATAYIAANPPMPPAPINTLDTILILRLEDGADSFISCHGAYLPSCFGMDLDALLTMGSSPMLAVEQLDQEGQQLLQQGLARRQLPVAESAVGPSAAAAAGSAAGGAAEGSLLGVELGELQLQQTGGVEGSSSSSGGAAGFVTGLEERVPKEVQRLVKYLKDCLHTPGLFVGSIPACCASLQPGKAPRNAAQLQQLLAATAPVRWALDTGLHLPGHVTGHQVTAALLLLLQQLPESFIPADVSVMLMHCVPPPPACTSLLSDAMSVVEWATLRHLLALFRAALGPAAAAGNGLTTFSLAAVLAEFLFGDSAAVPPELTANRVAFIMTLLDPEAAAAVAVQQEVAAANPAASWAMLPPPAAPVNQRGTSAALQPTVVPEESLI